MKLNYLLSLFLLTLPAAASGITIVSDYSGNFAADPLGYYASYPAYLNPGVGAVSWSQTATFKDVTLSADIWAVNANGSANYYLVNQIGASTTLANVIAHGTAALPSSPGMATLGTIASLGPGTYYLVIDSSVNNSVWDYAYQSTPTLTTAPSVTFLGDFNAKGSSVNSSFSPASGLGGTSLKYNFSVTAASVVSTPEPASLFLAAAGLSLVLWRKRRACSSSRFSWPKT